MAEDGTLTFSTEEPLPPATELGALSANADHTTPDGEGFIWANTASATTETWTNYFAESDDCVQIKKQGTDSYVSIGAIDPTLSGDGILLNRGDNVFCVRNSQWMLNCAGHSDITPMQAGDIMVVGGRFTTASGLIVNITKTYITMAEDGTLTFSTEEPGTSTPVTPDVIEAGAMGEHPNGNAASGFHFSMPANGVPVDATWATRYMPVSADVIKLTRNDITTSVGNVAAGTILKFGETDWWMEYWTIGGALQAGDILTVEGDFTNADKSLTFRISKSYVVISSTGAMSIGTTIPEEKEIVEAGTMKSHENGKNGDDGIYFTMNVNVAEYDTGWALEYAPLSTSSVKLIRGEETFDIGIENRGTIVKYSPTEYYLKTSAWTMGERMPLVDGDILVIEGAFAHGSTVMNITKSYVKISSGLAVISDTYPEEGSGAAIINAGAMRADPTNSSLNVNVEGGSCGIYFVMDENTLAYVNDWSTRLRPVNADAVKLLRGGETLSIGNPAAGEIVKYGDTSYYLALDKWAHPTVFPITQDDILLIEGNFTDGTTIFNISKTYISFSHGMAKFSTDYPTGGDDVKVVNTGNMTSDSRGRTDTGIYFDLAANEAPFSTDWTLAYAPVEAGAIKLIRNGETFDLGIPGRETIVKFSGHEYYLKTEKWTMGDMMPLRDGDILVVEGEFINSGEGVALNIPKTYIGIWYGMPFFSTTKPTGPAIMMVNAGNMHNDTARDRLDSGFYFTMEENPAPFRTNWTLEYSPVNASAIKLVRDGVTYNVGIPKRGAIVKFSETEYFFKTEAWSLGGLMPLKAGDELIIEGSFINSTVGTILKIDRTVVTISYSKAKAYIPMGDVELANGEEVTLTITDLPEGTKVNWKSEDKSRVSVDENGKLTAHMNRGTTRIFATAGEVGYMWEIKLCEKTEFGNVYLPSSDEEMTIGVWCGSYHEFDEAHLLQMEEAGVNLIIGVEERWVGGKGMKALLDRAADHGIRIIANLRDWDGTTVPEWADHEALEGFLMFDEPSATDFAALAALKAKFDALMPEDKVFFVNLFPQPCAYEDLFGENYNKNAVDYEKNYVLPFLNTVKPDLLSVDFYPTLDWKERDEKSIVIRPSYYQNMDTLAKYARDKGIPFAYTLLSAGHNTTDGSYPTPTDAEMRWQMAVGMAFGANSLSHYVYTSHEEEYTTMIGYDGFKITDLFYDVKQVNNELKSWSDIYMSYTYRGTSAVDTGDTNLMLERMAYDVAIGKYGCISAVTSDQDLLVGAFENDEKQFAYMITNAGNAKQIEGVDYLADFALNDAKVTVSLKNGSYKCVAVIRNGEISYVAVNADNTFTVEVGANEGVFVIPVLK